MRYFGHFLTTPVLTTALLNPTASFLDVGIVAQEDPIDIARSSPQTNQVIDCEIMIVGGGLAGTATAIESLLAGRTVCLTEITDWVGGQLSSQGTTALDESPKQHQEALYARGYNELRDRVAEKYGELNPGRCWVSQSGCFLPNDANTILKQMLADAEEEGDGELKWFPNTVIKALTLNPTGDQIESLVAIQHRPAPGTDPLNSEPLSAILADAYTYADSARLSKTIIRFIPTAPQPAAASEGLNWYVIEATETGELIALADVPYQLGIDPRSALNPSSPVTKRDPYCTQGFTYPFAMEMTEEPQTFELPDFYETYKPIYGFDPRPVDSLNSAEAYFNYVFTYRRIWSETPRRQKKFYGVASPRPGDISMQNWFPGNDYSPGTSRDNLIYTRNQLAATGQLQPGGWLGGLRTETLRKGEENAIGFFYWLATSDKNNARYKDTRFNDRIKDPQPNLRYLEGLDSPMGTAHGLAKYPYIREGRRIIGRPSFGYNEGFVINEIDISRNDFSAEYYRNILGPKEYLSLRRFLAGRSTLSAITQNVRADQIPVRTRSRIYPDSIGITQYSIDFHPCYAEYPVEKPGNTEREGIRRGHGQAYPAQIPLRAMIPQKIDNLLVAGKSIATSNIAAAAYRVHSFEWSVGAAAGHTADFALRHGVLPSELVDDLPRQEPLFKALKREIEDRGNPVQFPDTSIFNEDWEDWQS